MKNYFSIMVGALVALGTPSLPAAVFTIGDLTTPPGGTVEVPITLGDFANGLGYSFSVSWETADLQYQSATFDFTIPGSFFGFNETQVTRGALGVQYAHGVTPLGITDETTIVTITYQVLGGIGSQTPLNFVNAPIALEVTPGSPVTWNSGSLEVVPEPVNVALALFGALGIAATALRRMWKTSSCRTTAP